MRELNKIKIALLLEVNQLTKTHPSQPTNRVLHIHQTHNLPHTHCILYQRRLSLPSLQLLSSAQVNTYLLNHYLSPPLPKLSNHKSIPLPLAFRRFFLTTIPHSLIFVPEIGSPVRINLHMIIPNQLINLGPFGSPRSDETQTKLITPQQILTTSRQTVFNRNKILLLTKLVLDKTIRLHQHLVKLTRNHISTRHQHTSSRLP